MHYTITGRTNPASEGMFQQQLTLDTLQREGNKSVTRLRYEQYS